MQATLAARVPLPVTTKLRLALHALLQRSSSAADSDAATAVAAEPMTATRASLDHRRMAWVEHPAGRTVTCDAGALWVTLDGQQIDVVLEPGQSYYCRDDARMGIYALAPSSFRLDAAR